MGTESLTDSHGALKFQYAFLNCGIITCHSTNRPRLQFPRLAETWAHFDSTRRTSEPRDFILAIMPQYEFYTVPRNAKQMTFGQLFFDCCRQLEAVRETDLHLAPLLTSQFNITSGTPLPTDNIPEPACLGDLMKLLNGPRPLLEVNPLRPIPLRQSQSHPVDVRTSSRYQRHLQQYVTERCPKKHNQLLLQRSV